MGSGFKVVVRRIKSWKRRRVLKILFACTAKSFLRNEGNTSLTLASMTHYPVEP